MNHSKITVRYAKALFITAKEAKSLDEVKADVDTILKVYSFSLFKEMLESPVVKTSEKRKGVNEIFTGKVSSLTLNFFNLLLVNKRERYLPDILRNFKSLYKLNKGIKSAELTISAKIDDKFKSTFKELLKKTFNSEIELEEKIKPEIIGGFILKVEDEQYDASISSALAKIRKKLLETTSENKI
jgi:F-type H+-transporting ATPase subunit delta